jgi:hypothetical protein
LAPAAAFWPPPKSCGRVQGGAPRAHKPSRPSGNGRSGRTARQLARAGGLLPPARTPKKFITPSPAQRPLSRRRPRPSLGATCAHSRATRLLPPGWLSSPAYEPHGRCELPAGGHAQLCSLTYFSGEMCSSTARLLAAAGAQRLPPPGGGGVPQRPPPRLQPEPAPGGGRAASGCCGRRPPAGCCCCCCCCKGAPNDQGPARGRQSLTAVSRGGMWPAGDGGAGSATARLWPLRVYNFHSAR